MTGGQAKLAVAAVFLAGVVTGVSATRLVQLRAEAAILRSPDPLPQVILWKMGRDLSLTPAQREEARAALADARKQVFEATPEILPRFLEIYDGAVGRISRSLDPRQRARFEQVAGKKREMLARMVENAKRPAPPPPPAAPPPK